MLCIVSATWRRAWAAPEISNIGRRWTESSVWIALSFSSSDWGGVVVVDAYECDRRDEKRDSAARGEKSGGQMIKAEGFFIKCC